MQREEDKCGKLLQSCLTLCDPMDCSLPVSSVHRILQARILEQIAMPSSRGSSQQGLNPRLLHLLPWQADSFLTESPRKPIQFSSAAQSCLILCNSVDCSMPRLPVHHQLLAFTQTHVH